MSSGALQTQTMNVTAFSLKGCKNQFLWQAESFSDPHSEQPSPLYQPLIQSDQRLRINLHSIKGLVMFKQHFFSPPFFLYLSSGCPWMAELYMSGIMSNEGGKKHWQTQSLILITYVTVEQLKLDRFKIIVHSKTIIVIIFSVISDMVFFFPWNKGTNFDECTGRFSCVIKANWSF